MLNESDLTRGAPDDQISSVQTMKSYAGRPIRSVTGVDATVLSGEQRDGD